MKWIVRSSSGATLPFESGSCFIVSSNRLKKVQGKKKRDNATKAESSSQDNPPAVEHTIPEDEASANLLSTKDDDVIF